uniref:C2H2-type domain-containing protein n=1 Tax=Sinocyclocheilus anshuiensis TaxID=1608454 RepID=A0A671MMX3_9TELE
MLLNHILKLCGKFLRAAYMTDHLKKHSEGPHNYCGICNKGTGQTYHRHTTAPPTTQDASAQW